VLLGKEPFSIFRVCFVTV